MTLFLILNSIVILMLVILAALFASSETAIIASSKAVLHHFTKKGNQNAKIIAHLRKNMGRLVSTLMILNTVITILSSNLAAHLFIEVFGTVGVAYASGVMCVLVVIYGEVLPKIYAIQHPETLAMRIAYILNFVVKILSPLTHITESIARKSLLFFGIKLKESSMLTTTEELRNLIEMHVGPGTEIAHERAMLRSVLDLGTVEVGEIMTHRKNIKMLDINLEAEKIIEVMLESPYTRIPLWENDPENIIGILHAKALFRALKEAPQGDLSKINLRIIASEPWFVPDTTALLDQLQAFRERREHFAIVVDEYGGLMGVVTLEDILEEIVGEIIDEHDIEIPGVRLAPDKSILITGTVTIRDLNRQFEWSLPDEEAVTIAGLILHETRQIPEVGQKFNIHNFSFEILRRQRNQITLLRVIPPKENKTEES